MALPSGYVTFSTVRDRLGISGMFTMSALYATIDGGPSSGMLKIADIQGKNVTYSFITGGKTGSAGPTLAQMQGSRPWAVRTITMNALRPGIQIWQVPRAGTYRVLLAGARGNTRNSFIGYGAVMRGDFTWTAGQQIQIIAGQLGIDHNQWRPGGGASWVTDMSNTPFIVAGGGGGGSGTTYTGHAPVASNGVNGVTSSPGGGCANTANPGGQNGNGGSGQGVFGGNCGGGGLSTAGTGDLAGSGGRAFVDGALGGVGHAGCEGGFGCGGACIGNGGCPAGGGGGGYSGGGGASGDDAAAGGGGSFNTGANPSNAAGTNTGEGYVTISLLTIPIQRYPPAAMTSDTTTFSGQAYGNGTYIASGYTPASTSPFTAFDTNPATNFASSGGFNNNVWTGTSTTFTGAGTYAGSWIRIDLPLSITPTQIGIIPANALTGLQNVSLLGSIDGTNWTILLNSISGISYTGSTNNMTPRLLSVTTNSSFTKFVLVWTAISATGNYTARLADFFVNGS